MNKKDNKVKVNKNNDKKQLKKKQKKNKKARFGKIKVFFAREYKLTILDILIGVVILVILSSVSTGFILNYQYKKSNVLYKTSLVSDDDLSEFIKTYSEIVDNYFEDIDKKGMLSAAMSGMMEFLEDNYSIYLDKNESEALDESLDASYKGVGILIAGRVIQQVYKDSPAERAGIKAGDEIIEVNEVKITDDNFQDIATLIQENGDKESTIIVKRDKEELTFKVRMETVVMDTTTSKVIENGDKKVGYIALSTFAAQSFEHFEESLMSLEDEGIDSLIIDLRGNSGGYLNVAYDISSMFLEKGKLIYSLESKDQVTEYKDKTDEKRDYNVVVLVNGVSASASEILASALKDSYGATLVGKKTFGKGKVQTLTHYEESTVKYTSAKWLRPNGDCVDEVGITPDYEVDNEVKDKKFIDNQLDKALELLK